MFKVPNAVPVYIVETRIVKRHRSEISIARCCEFTGPSRKPKGHNSKIRKYDALNRVLLSQCVKVRFSEQSVAELVWQSANVAECQCDSGPLWLSASVTASQCS